MDSIKLKDVAATEEGLLTSGGYPATTAGSASTLAL
jgi:hypothetical protein